MIDVYKKLISYANEKKHLLFIIILLSIVSVILQALAFYYVYKLLENVIYMKMVDDAKNYAFKIAGLFAGGGVMYFFCLTTSHLFAFRLETNMRKHGIDSLTNASFKYFDMNTSGKTRKLIDDNAAQTHTAVAHLIPDNVGAMVMPILILILGFFIHIRVGLVLLILLVLSAFLMYFMMGEQKFMKMYQASMERLSSETVEYIRGMQVVKIFGVDVRSFKALNEAIQEYARHALNYSLSCKIPYVIYQGLFFGLALIILPLVILFLDNSVDPRELSLQLMMTILLSGMTFVYMLKVMYLSMHLFHAKDAVEKLEKLFDEMQNDAMEFGNLNQFKNYDIEFENVSFSYKPELPILDGLSFKLQANRSYALVGASGSGKSTIVKLISGFYKVNEGQVKIGGENIASYTKDALINSIAFVFQDSKLFKTSIYENVALANKNACKEEVFEAMHLAGVDSITEKFKNKENTVIGSKGVFLSGGEKQRIAIARAILKDAKIIIFDEASAAIDPDNEHELQKSFANLMKNKTVIMIAHRLTTIRKVDEILVLEDGKIVERGSDGELMKKDASYKRFQNLYKMANDWRVVDESIL